MSPARSLQPRGKTPSIHTVMRVIAGSAKGHRLRGLRGLEVRPTADRVKEALFSIVSSRFDLSGASVLDLFAGTGGLGIEALSRGAQRAVFVERHGPMARALEANLLGCGFRGRAELLILPVERALRKLADRGDRFDGVLLDPPYERGWLERTMLLLGEAAILNEGAWVMAEHHIDEPLAQAYGALRLTQTRSYGKTGLALFVRRRPEGE
jgi:16S rRNA (guanine(966)-N(2))-methyltransferase RsmD